MNTCRHCGVEIPRGSRNRKRKFCSPGHYYLSKFKGDDIKEVSGRTRAIRLYPETKSCEKCDRNGERHHKDGNTANNSPGNIQWLCRKHHMEEDQRTARRKRGEFGRFI